MWTGDFNFEEPLTDGAAGHGGAPSARERMLEAYAAVCAKLGTRADGGLEDAYRVTHSGRRAPTSKVGRSIDRVLIDPQMIGGVPGIVAADTVHRTDLQVTGAKRIAQAPSRARPLRAAHHAPVERY